MTSPRDRDRVLILSDLHLSTGAHSLPDDPEESFFHDDELAGLLAAYTSGPERADVVLLLGDVFELPGYGRSDTTWRGTYDVTIEALVERVDRIALAHRVVVDALHRFVEDGGEVHMVPGNHDPALLHPVVFEHVRNTIAPELRHRIILHPVSFQIRGLLYAEHGHQRHIWSAFRHAARPWSASTEEETLSFEEPIIGAMARLHVSNDQHRRTRVARSWFALIGSFVSNTWRRRTTPQNGTSAPSSNECAADTVAIGAPLPKPSTMMRDAARSLLARARGGSYRPALDLPSAADAIDGQLARSGRRVAVCAFGHSHRAELDVRSPSLVYLNTGSWAQWAGHSTTPPRRHHAMVWSDDTGAAHVELRTYERGMGLTVVAESPVYPTPACSENFPEHV